MPESDAYGSFVNPSPFPGEPRRIGPGYQPEVGGRGLGLAGIPAVWADPPAHMVSILLKQGTPLPYMGHGWITLALISIDPFWTLEPLMVDGRPGLYRETSVFTKRDGTTIPTERWVMWAYLTVLGHKRLCVGTCTTDKADPEKELIGDALRNGALRFGVATNLWSKADKAKGSDGPALISSSEAEALFAQIKSLSVAQKADLRTRMQQRLSTVDPSELTQDQLDEMHLIITAVKASGDTNNPAPAEGR